MATVIKQVIDLVGDGATKDSDRTQQKNSKMSLENQSFVDIFVLINSHSEYLKLLPCNNICSEGDKEEILSKVNNTYKMIHIKSNPQAAACSGVS